MPSAMQTILPTENNLTPHTSLKNNMLPQNLPRLKTLGHRPSDQL